jgi:hypothetical protein
MKQGHCRSFPQGFLPIAHYPAHQQLILGLIYWRTGLMKQIKMTNFSFCGGAPRSASDPCSSRTEPEPKHTRTNNKLCSGNLTTLLIRWLARAQIDVLISVTSASKPTQLQCTHTRNYERLINFHVTGCMLEARTGPGLFTARCTQNANFSRLLFTKLNIHLFSVDGSL